MTKLMCHISNFSLFLYQLFSEKTVKVLLIRSRMKQLCSMSSVLVSTLLKMLTHTRRGKKMKYNNRKEESYNCQKS